jgi:Transmembrane amino acid transporter protein
MNNRDDNVVMGADSAHLEVVVGTTKKDTLDGIVFRRRTALPFDVENDSNPLEQENLEEDDSIPFRNDDDDEKHETQNLLVVLDEKQHHLRQIVLPVDRQSSMMASIFNLVNNVAGAGILTLPAGQAAGDGTGWIPAVLIATGLGLISAQTFIMIGKACELTQESDFKVRTVKEHQIDFASRSFETAVLQFLFRIQHFMTSCFRDCGQKQLARIQLIF